MKRWYVATTKGSQKDLEHYAARQLLNQGLRAWVPMTYRREGIGRDAGPRPYVRFNGYVFVLFDATLEEHGPINNTHGVGKLLCASDEGRTPQRLRLGLIDGLREAEIDEFAAAKAAKDSLEAQRMTPGMLVVIARLNGQVGQLVGMVDGRATVLVGNRMVRVSILDIAPAPSIGRKRLAA